MYNFVLKKKKLLDVVFYSKKVRIEGLLFYEEKANLNLNFLKKEFGTRRTRGKRKKTKGRRRS